MSGRQRGGPLVCGDVSVAGCGGSSGWLLWYDGFVSRWENEPGALRPSAHGGAGLVNTSPVGLFVTWTVYGTHLPGDWRGWRRRQGGPRHAQPRLELWHRSQLKYDVVTLDAAMRRVAEAALVEICRVRKWSLWAVAVRSNHVHVVVTAPEYDPEVVRDQLKAKATKELREVFPVWVDRPVWSAKGDIEFLDSEAEIEECVLYVAVAQDRKDRDL